jgi:hypothetical protein
MTADDLRDKARDFWMNEFGAARSIPEPWLSHYARLRECLGKVIARAGFETLVLVGPGRRPTETDLDVLVLLACGVRRILVVDYFREVAESAAADLVKCGSIHTSSLVCDITGGLSLFARRALSHGDVEMVRHELALVAVDDSPCNASLSVQISAELCGPALIVFSMCLASTASVEYGEFLSTLFVVDHLGTDVRREYVRYNGLVLEQVAKSARDLVAAGHKVLFISDVAWIGSLCESQFEPPFDDVIWGVCGDSLRLENVDEWTWTECADHGHRVRAILVTGHATCPQV